MSRLDVPTDFDAWSLADWAERLLLLDDEEAVARGAFARHFAAGTEPDASEVDAFFEEVSRREEALAGGYPFRLDGAALVLDAASQREPYELLSLLSCPDQLFVAAGEQDSARRALVGVVRMAAAMSPDTTVVALQPSPDAGQTSAGVDAAAVTEAVRLTGDILAVGDGPGRSTIIRVVLDTGSGLESTPPNQVTVAVASTATEATARGLAPARDRLLDRLDLCRALADADRGDAAWDPMRLWVEAERGRYLGRVAVPQAARDRKPRRRNPGGDLPRRSQSDDE